MSSNKKLSATISIGGTVAGSLKAAFGDVKGKFAEIGKTVDQLKKKQKELSTDIIKGAKQGTRTLEQWRNEYAKVTAQIERAQKAQDRLVAAQKFKAGVGKVGGYLQGAAIRSAATGASLGAGLYTGVRAAIARENAVNVIRNSGVSTEEGDRMVKAAEGSKQFGVSITDATHTVSELRTVLGNTKEAIEALPTSLKVISGLKMYDRLHGSGLSEDDSAYNLAKFAEERGGGSSPEALREKQNWGFKLITGTGNKVTAADILLAQRNGKSATAGMTDESFAHDAALMVAMGASKYATASSTAYQSLVGGHAQDMSKAALAHAGLMTGVAFNKLGGVDSKKSRSAALVDQDLYIRNPQAWVEKYIIPLAQKAGVKFDSSGNAVDASAVSSFVAGFHLNSATSNILENRIRLRGNQRKDANNVDIAPGIEKSDAANKQSTAGKMDNAHARLNDAQARMGSILVPRLASAMEKLANVLEDVDKWGKENPKTFKAVVEGLGAIAVGATVLAPVLAGAAGIMSTIAAIRLARAASEVSAVTRELSAVEGAAATAGGGLKGLGGTLMRFGALVGVAYAAANIIDGIAGKMGVGGKAIDAKQDDANWSKMNWWQHAYSGVARGIEKTGRFVGLDNIANEAQAGRIKSETDYFAKKQPPAVPAAKSSSSTTVNVPAINVYAQPNQDTKEIADAVMKRINQQNSAKSRSIMFDGANQ
jgi:hypothetical protein